MSQLVCRREGRVETVLLNRPPLNILDLATVAELRRKLGSWEADEDLALVVFQGSGDRAFSAGVAVEDHLPETLESMLQGFHDVVRRLRTLPALTLAAVRGHCLGGGLELATACDFILAEETANLGLPEIKLGCFPPVAAALYPQRLGYDRALELILTGRKFPATEGLAMGLITWTAPPGGLEARLKEILAELLTPSSAVARLAKKALLAGQGRRFPEALQAAEDVYVQDLVKTRDMQEGLDAFLERRKPLWQHR
jgi:cyclohexa-1,5-dienecarbonyl-CoA hydratase